MSEAVERHEVERLVAAIGDSRNPAKQSDSLRLAKKWLFESEVGSLGIDGSSLALLERVCAQYQHTNFPGNNA